MKNGLRWVQLTAVVETILYRAGTDLDDGSMTGTGVTPGRQIAVVDKTQQMPKHPTRHERSFISNMLPQQPMRNGNHLRTVPARLRPAKVRRGMVTLLVSYTGSMKSFGIADEAQGGADMPQDSVRADAAFRLAPR